mgnify:CR=1 FL=1
MRKQIRGMILFILVFCIWVLPARAEAIITFSPDGTAFTTNAGETQTKSYTKDYEVSTGVKGTLREPGTGEHLYDVIRRDTVPVKKWKVALSRTVCQHHSYPAGNQYHGVNFQKAPCYQNYYSGWFPYCADCGEVVADNYFYMSEQVAKSIGYLDMSKSYYYKCPHCDNLEQGNALISHTCKDISPNRYFIRYHANFGSGYMEKSTHMVNNATVYEGRSVTPQTTLNLNTYTRVGYEFAEWNTKKDGSGRSYADGEEIYNLSMEENDSVVLYAQWRKRKSVLEIDPNGGLYDGETTIQRVTGEYQTRYELQDTLITPPQGFRVQFHTLGGEKIEPVYGTMRFSGWECVQPFQGSLSEKIYSFLGKNGAVDRIKILYEPEAIELPEAVREGYSFGGWFADKEAQVPIGMAGDSYIPTKDITLYASWVDLKLVSDDNYAAYEGTGAVDLSWVQKDNRDKIYEVYQRCEEEEWEKLDSFEEINDNSHMSKTISFSGTMGEYTVPFSGFYTLKLSGAQGGDCGSFQGGKGGLVTATVYLEKGEKLQYQLGGQNAYPNGGSGVSYGNGGGGSCVSTERTGILLVAGGGGGASVAVDGGAGGLKEHLMQTEAGESGECGGGGGYQGGVSGNVLKHQHTQECRHLHIGTPDICGGCYTIPTRCQSTDIKYVVTKRVFYYGNIADDGSHIFCVRCGSYECPGHLDIYGVYTCQRCSAQSEYPITQCSAMTGYALSCEQDETYICGYTQEQVVQIKESSGGSNYINGEYCIDFKEESGMQTGDGMLWITAERVNFLMARERKGVKATDLASPDEIEESTIHKTAVGEAEVRISWKRPADRGTDYYHRVESYDIHTMESMCHSNITKNTLSSGVIGYRYVVDSYEDTEVGGTHTLLRDKSPEPFLSVEMEEAEKYLHIAPQDKAGNIGTTIHIPISKKEIIYWPIRTEKLELKEGPNLLKTDEADTYFVRADGNTPIQVTLLGELLGNARDTYQIDEATYQVRLGEEQEYGMYSLLVPKRQKLTAGSYTYPSEEIRKRQAGELHLQDASYTRIQRYNTCRSLQVKQQFLVPESLDGRVLSLTPQVAVQGEGEKIYSNPELDKENSIRLIGDGKGPDIKGGEQLEELQHVDYGEHESVRLEFTAVDNGSGLAEFYIEVRNPDNGASAFYEDTQLTGHLELNIREEDSLYVGEFYVMVYAKDRVGNESILTTQNVGVALEAYVTRVLEPHTSTFKKGESGILHISSWGYIDRLEVLFPQSLAMGETVRVITYEIPAALKQEEISFIVPLNAIEGQQTIQIKAYKNGICLDEETGLVTIEVTGSVLDEFRTRLR